MYDPQLAYFRRTSSPAAAFLGGHSADASAKRTRRVASRVLSSIWVWRTASERYRSQWLIKRENANACRPPSPALLSLSYLRCQRSLTPFLEVIDTVL